MSHENTGLLAALERLDRTKPPRCYRCGKTCQSHKGLVQHLSYDVRDCFEKTEKGGCAGCGRTFDSLPAWARHVVCEGHLRAHYTDDERRRAQRERMMFIARGRAAWSCGAKSYPPCHPAHVCRRQKAPPPAPVYGSLEGFIVPNDAASGDAASGDAAFGDAASGDAASGDAASGDAAFGDADDEELLLNAEYIAAVRGRPTMRKVLSEGERIIDLTGD